MKIVYVIIFCLIAYLLYIGFTGSVVLVPTRGSSSFLQDSDTGEEMCSFLDSDVYNNNVFTDENKPVTTNLQERTAKNKAASHLQVKCSDCKKYIYKTDDDRCSYYDRDTRYTDLNSLSLCTALQYPKPCTKIAKILQ